MAKPLHETLQQLAITAQLVLVALYTALWGVLALPFHLALFAGVVLLRAFHFAVYYAFLLLVPLISLFFPFPPLTIWRFPRFRFYWREDQPLHDYAYRLMLYLYRDPEVAAEHELLG